MLRACQWGLYAYFDTKDTLLKMILSEVTDAVQRTLSTPPPEVYGDPVAHLNWLIDAHVRMTEKCCLGSLFFHGGEKLSRAARQKAVDSEELTERYIADVLNEGIASHVFRSDTSPLLAALIKPLLQDWYVKRTKYQRRAVPIDTYISTVQTLILSACLEKSGSGVDAVIRTQDTAAGSV